MAQVMPLSSQLASERRPGRRVAFAVLGFGLVCMAAALAAAQGGAVAAPPEVAWGPTTAAADVPQEMAAGYTLFSLESPSDNGATLTLYRLKEGVTQEQLAPALEAVDRSFMGEGDPVEAINAALELADIVVELDVEPGLTQSVGVMLEEGEYLLDHSPYPMEEGALRARTLSPVSVSGEAQAQAPTPTAEVAMADFAFELPSSLQAGEQTWRVTNVGEQLHHMVVLRLADGATLQDALGWLETEEGPPPGEPVAYAGIMSPGYSADYTLDLTPGRYVAICFMPDHRGDATGMPHFMLGMVQEFEIAAE